MAAGWENDNSYKLSTEQFRIEHTYKDGLFHCLLLFDLRRIRKPTNLCIITSQPNGNHIIVIFHTSLTSSRSVVYRIVLLSFLDSGRP